MRVQRLVLTWALGVVGGLASAGSAQAFVTLGPNLSDPGFAGAPCTFADGCTIGITSAPGRPTLAPSDGVIVRWRFRGDGANTLRVLRLSGTSTGLGDGTGPTATGGGCATVVEVATRVPIKAGEIIGSNSFGAAGVCGTPTPVSGAGYAFWNPVLLDGQTRNGLSGAREFAEQADVEADPDHDGFGNETQDNCLETAGSISGCPSTVAISALSQDGRRSVTVTVTVPGQGTVAAGAANDPALAAAAKLPLMPVTRTLTDKSQQQVVLTLPLTKSAKKKLKRKHKLRLQVKATYTPTGGPPASQTSELKLRVGKRKKR